MQKKIIALAIAAAIAAPVAAMADSTVYGQANVSYDFADNGNKSQGQVVSNASRLGFKGSDDLGSGLTAIYQIESGVALDAGSGATTFTMRNTFAGISSKEMGTVVLGTHDTPYKLSTRKFDLFADTVADNRNLMGAGGVSFDGRQGNVIAYLSPDFSGFSGAVAYTNVTESFAGSADLKAASGSLAYNAGPLAASLGYEKHNFNGAERAWKFGIGYTVDAFTGNFIYENIRNGSTGAALDHNAFQLAGKYAFSSTDAIKVAYIQRGNIENAANTKAKQFSFGYDHGMSKNTTVYALYTRLDNSSASAAMIGGASSTATPGAFGVAGKDPSAFSFGMKHSF